MEEILKEIIKNFAEKNKLEYVDNFEMKFVTDISEYIRNDDLKYYQQRKESIDDALGMLYEDLNGQLIILVKKQDVVNCFATVIHEYVHLCDYNKLIQHHKDLTFRELQDDYVFLYWTEFHATYLSYRYLIGTNPQKIDVISVKDEVVNELVDYNLSTCQPDRCEIMDKTVRAYGKYLALHDEFCDKLPLSPIKIFFYNKIFWKIYRFFIAHKTFDDFIVEYADFKKLLCEI